MTMDETHGKKIEKTQGMTMEGIPEVMMTDMSRGGTTLEKTTEEMITAMNSESKRMTSINQGETKADVKIKAEEGQIRKTLINLLSTKAKSHPRNILQIRKKMVTGGNTKKNLLNRRKVIKVIHPKLRQEAKNLRKVKGRNPGRGHEVVDSKIKK